LTKSKVRKNRFTIFSLRISLKFFRLEVTAMASSV
jgi:hypothetical protein